jgi:hypothetical protein
MGEADRWFDPSWLVAGDKGSRSIITQPQGSARVSSEASPNVREPRRPPREPDTFSFTT